MSISICKLAESIEVDLGTTGELFIPSQRFWSADKLSSSGESDPPVHLFKSDYRSRSLLCVQVANWANKLVDYNQVSQ